MNRNLKSLSIILFFLSIGGNLFGGMPDKLAYFSLDSIPEAEKTGLSFHDVMQNTGIKNRGVYLNEKSFIKIPVYPSFRKDAQMPELNLNAQSGCLELCFKTGISADKNSPQYLFYFKPIGTKALFEACLQNDNLCFQITDENGKKITAATPSKLTHEKFHHIALNWKLDKADKAEISIYVDGEKKASAKESLGDIGISSPDFFIGSPFGKSANGKYDEISLWNKPQDNFELKYDQGKNSSMALPVFIDKFDTAKEQTEDPLLGKCLDLKRSIRYMVNFDLSLPEGMIEFWIKPRELSKSKSSVFHIENDKKIPVSLCAESGKLILDFAGTIIETGSILQPLKWNSISISWNYMTQKIDLLVNDEKFTGNIPSGQQTYLKGRPCFGMNAGTPGTDALLKGFCVLDICTATGKIGERGFLLSGNQDLSDASDSAIPIHIDGIYTITPEPDGKTDIRPDKGPFSFREGHLTDSFIDAMESHRISTYRDTDIMVDLKNIYELHKISVCVVEENKWRYGKIVFSISQDGKTWTEISSIENKNPATSGNRVPRKEESPYFKHPARYVKIKVSPQKRFLQSISEFYIYGIPLKEKQQ